LNAGFLCTLTAVNHNIGLGRLAGFFGSSDVMGRLHGTLLLSPEPLSLDELCDTTPDQQRFVSMNMRDLERWGMAKEVWVRGERRKFYKAESDMWQVIRNVLGSREQREVLLALGVLGESIEKLQAAERDLSADEQQLARYYLDRIGDLQAFFQFAQLALQTCWGGQRSILRRLRG
jgi:DNA-binding transcriptional regulator GbsR (MarR family)